MCTLAAGRARGKHGIPLGGRGKGWLMKVATVPASPKWGGGHSRSTGMQVPEPRLCKRRNKTIPIPKAEAQPIPETGPEQAGRGRKGTQMHRTGPSTGSLST